MAWLFKAQQTIYRLKFTHVRPAVLTLQLVLNTDC